MHHRSEVNACAFGRGGTLVATACNDRTAKLWDAATAARTRTLNGCVRTACAVVAALASRNDALERLTARGLFRDDGDTFAAFLGHLRPARRLRHLDLSGNGLGRGATRLRVSGSSGGGCWSRALESLVLRDDDLVPRAVEQVLLGGPRGKPPRSPRLDAFAAEPHHRASEASLSGRSASVARGPGSHHGPLAPPPTDAPRKATADWRRRHPAAAARGAWYWREADASKVGDHRARHPTTFREPDLVPYSREDTAALEAARGRGDTFLALKTRRVDLLLMEELDTTLLTKKAVARVAEAAPDAAALPGDVEATGLPRLELDPDEIVEVEEEAQLVSSLGETWHVRRFGDTVSSSSDAIKVPKRRVKLRGYRERRVLEPGDAVDVRRSDADYGSGEEGLARSASSTRSATTRAAPARLAQGWVKARLGGDSYAVFMEASDDDVYYGTREDGAKELEGVFDRADIFAAFDEPHVADEAVRDECAAAWASGLAALAAHDGAAAEACRLGLAADRRVALASPRKRAPRAAASSSPRPRRREEDWRVDALDGVLEACRGAFRSALAASPEARRGLLARGRPRRVASDRIAKVAAVLQRQLLLESQPSLDRGPVLELESVARVDPDPRVARGFARALSRCRNRHRPDAAKTEETRRTPQQDAVLRTLEARKTGLAGASLAEGWDDGVTVFHGGEPSKLRAVMDDGFRGAVAPSASLPPGRLKLSLRRCAVVGDGAARLEDVAVSLTSSMNAGTDDAAPETLAARRRRPRRDDLLPVASGALRVDLTVKPTHCFKAHGSDRLHFKETTITVPVYSCAPDGLQVNPVDGAAILPFCVDVPLELASGEEVDDVDQGEGQGATTPASVSPRDGAGHVAGLRSSFHGLAETKAADLHVRLEGVATMHYDIPLADYEKSARGGRRTWGKHYGRGHYTSTEPAYATLYSAAFGGGHADNVLVDVAHHANATGLANPKMVSPRAPPSKVEVLRDSLSVSFWMKRSSALDLGSRASSSAGGADEEVKTTFRVDGDRRTNEDEWWHVAVVFDGDDARCKIYMNGDLDGSNSPHLAVRAGAGATRRAAWATRAAVGHEVASGVPGLRDADASVADLEALGVSCTTGGASFEVVAGVAPSAGPTARRARTCSTASARRASTTRP
ncbi:hypothetical protein JL722_15154 [Aureococcus anophagefferens]|nr:hypothetical protein JL722_15154 [Aureococcus anophagefferens]